ncbi:MAG: hydrogenase formation protein HypD [Oscillospiraceae bacterium]|nr:hydrogenase formation protein HypD [Oscillospiraceae bacterium]
MPSDKAKRDRLLAAIAELDVDRVRLMEVCGTHTMAIAASGIRSMLPENVSLLSGPGCPVCVTPPQVIDAVLELSMEKDVILASYGDMLRVPGSRPGDSLLRRRALGAQVETVYSSVDAVELALQHPEKQLVFLGVGFETTAPGTAAAVLTAQEKGAKNFTLWSMLKTVEPALRALIALDGFQIDGFLCPGHVATIIGERGFAYLPAEFHLPGVVAGFEPEDILLAVYLLLRQIKEGKPRIENAYPRAVSHDGNVLAQRMIARCFEARGDVWRGLGAIPASGLGLREELSGFDAEKRFQVRYAEAEPPTACRCGEVITGRRRPEACPLFGRACTPEDPVGPCMVSSEGACAAAYKYQGVL